MKTIPHKEITHAVNVSFDIYEGVKTKQEGLRQLHHYNPERAEGCLTGWCVVVSQLMDKSKTRVWAMNKFEMTQLIEISAKRGHDKQQMIDGIARHLKLSNDNGVNTPGKWAILEAYTKTMAK